VGGDIIRVYACRDERVWGDPMLVGVEGLVRVFGEGVSSEKGSEILEEVTERVCTKVVRV
jgi:hypothetical protein